MARRLKVVVADESMAWHAALMQSLAGADIEWLVHVTDSDVELAPLLADADVLINGSISPALAEAAPRLRLVQTTGAGYNHLDLEHLPSRITIANNYHHERGIGEYNLMAMIALSRRLVQSDAHLRQGQWDSVFAKSTMPVAHTLRGKTLGLLGYGRISRETVRLSKPFDMRYRAVTRRPQAAPLAEAGLEWVGGPDALPDLLANSDFVLVTVPLSDATRGMIGATQLAQMRPTAYLINVARGPVVDEAALYEALKARRIAGAAIDVWYNYPEGGPGPTQPSAYPFHELDNVLMTPHVSGVVAETFETRARTAAENIRRLAAGEPLLNVIHPQDA